MPHNCRGATATPPSSPHRLRPRPLTDASCIIRRSPADRCRSSIPITSYSCGAFDTWGKFENFNVSSAALSQWEKKKEKAICPLDASPVNSPHFNTLNGAQQPGQRASYYICDPLTPDKTRQFVAATFAQPDFPLKFHYHLFFSSFCKNRNPLRLL